MAAQLRDALGQCSAIGGDHAAFAGRDGFQRMETERCGCTQGMRPNLDVGPVVVAGPKGMGGVFDQCDVKFCAKVGDPVKTNRVSSQMHGREQIGQGACV